MIVIVLAGGKSSRFSPLSDKNFIEYFGKSMAEYGLKRLELLNPESIILVSSIENQKKYEKLIAGVSVPSKVIIQVGEGMAGATVTAISSMKNKAGDILIVNMDDWLDDSRYIQFEKQVQQLKSENENALTGFKVIGNKPLGYLSLNDGFVKDIIEKPSVGEEPSEYGRIVFDYFYNAEKFLNVLKTTKSENDDVYEQAISKMIKDGEKFKMIEHKGAWEIMKYPWHVLTLMFKMLGELDHSAISPKAQISDKAIIKGNVIIEDGVKIYEGAIINGPVYLGKNVIVGNNSLVRESMIGSDSVVGYATEVARSYVGKNVWFHRNYIGDSVIDDNVSFGSGAVTGNLRLDEENICIKIKNELVDTGYQKIGAIVGKNVRVGVNTSIMPGVRIGSGTFITSGIVVKDDVENNKYVYTKSEMFIKENKVDIGKKNRNNLKSVL